MTEKSEENINVNNKDGGEMSPWYYFYSVGCGFCKKAEPVIDELNASGKYPEILKLDMAEQDNQALNRELQEEYGKRCGTPWFINADTGNAICGFREKDVIEKWLDGEDIPAPPRPNGPMPRPPFMNDSNRKNLRTFKKEYKKWADDNAHLPGLLSAEEVLEKPRPNSEPPKMISPQSTAEDIEKFRIDYNKWAEDNDHLPNLQNADMIINRFKNRRWFRDRGKKYNSKLKTGC